jgi:hypothetical protein
MKEIYNCLQKVLQGSPPRVFPEAQLLTTRYVMQHYTINVSETNNTTGTKRILISVS